MVIEKTGEVHEPPKGRLLKSVRHKLALQRVGGAYYFHLSIDRGNVFLGFFYIKITSDFSLKFFGTRGSQILSERGWRSRTTSFHGLSS